MEDFLKLSHAKAIKASLSRFIFNDETAKLLNTACQKSLLSNGDDTSVSLAVAKYKHILCFMSIFYLCREDWRLDAEQKMSPEHLLITDSNRAHHLSSKVGKFSKRSGQRPTCD